ncbi:hypothetical protein QFW96_09545 [Saccharopolyspora sp. TS4A08]|uniref:ABM domain-containing protein n=1 Tax=Saccharopolyspora ipomoeae TaxID=3042027 RepID=A0ABT6PLI0_9PSEU|nr:hypothetical protein [Saccharopolyspora sp. TS4A08]MDI2028855.1 hypothetical protein [Saccharopolyspora sp. TS4A08]
MLTSDEGPILFHNTMKIAAGHLDQFVEAVRRAVAFAEVHGPQLMVDVHVDEERMLAHSFQLYRDSDAIREHWRLSDPYIRGVMEHCEVERFEVYGAPDDAVREGLQPMAESGIPLTITGRTAGFARFLEDPEKL